MRYFELSDDVEFLGRWTLEDPVTDRGCDSFDFRRGRVAIVGEPVVEIHSPGVPLQFSTTLLYVPIATSALAEAIAQVAGADLQRIPVTLGNRGGYEVLNSLRVERCLDESRSEFMKWTERDGRADRLGDYRWVTRLYIHGDQLPPDAHFFRIEGWLIDLIVSELVKAAMERVGCLGAVFREVT